MGIKCKLAVCGLFFAASVGADVAANELSDLAYYEQVLSAPPLLPAAQGADSGQRTAYRFSLGERFSANPAPGYLTQEASGIAPGWEARVASDWQFFAVPAKRGKIALIDFAATPEGTGYRYLANANTQHQLYEPWSSSKIMAIAAALASLGRDVGPTTRVGDVALADLVTSVNSYAPSGNADGNSNAIATYFANIAGREKLTGLFHALWLQLSDPDIRFRGAYGPAAFVPSSRRWQWSESEHSEVRPYVAATDDPFYQSYRCEQCGVTGNKPMSTLAQAEFLKRLVSHEFDTLSRLPGLKASHVTMLLYGPGHSNSVQAAGGMQAGISLMLARAIAQALAPEASEPANLVLDAFTGGQWRIFQKIGAGPSETRGRSETVLLAHVVLPLVDAPPREFTIAVQTAVDGVSEAGVGRAAKAMQQVLNISMAQLLSSELPKNAY